MMMLGAAAPRLRPQWIATESSKRWAGVAVGLGVLLFAGFLGPLWVTSHRMRGGTAESTGAAARWFWEDPVVADAVAWKFAGEAIHDPKLIPEALERSAMPTRIAPDRPYWWAEHARRLIELGQFESVPDALARAFELDTWNPSAWEAQLAYAIAVRDEALAQRTRAVLCQLDTPLCITGSRAPKFENTTTG
jgi:hypothetical protein